MGAELRSSVSLKGKLLCANIRADWEVWASWVLFPALLFCIGNLGDLQTCLFFRNTVQFTYQCCYTFAGLQSGVNKVLGNLTENQCRGDPEDNGFSFETFGKLHGLIRVWHWNHGHSSS
jgi:hypothetical protein